jgi:hypothetical protein
MPRFALLLHALPDGAAHYDLLLERDGGLAAWRLPAPLRDLPPGGADAVQLKDHRVHYLTYEGDIGGGRGSVRRVDEGTYEAAAWDGGRVEAAVTGRVAAGRLELRRGTGAAAAWRARFEPGGGILPLGMPEIL